LAVLVCGRQAEREGEGGREEEEEEEKEEEEERILTAG